MNKYLPTITVAMAFLTGGASAAPPQDIVPTQRVWVEFAPGQGNSVQRALASAKARVHYRFDNLNAFAASVPEAALAGLQSNPKVVAVEEDPKRYPVAQQIPYGIDAVQARDVWDADRGGTVDSGAPDGSGVRVCVIDSGVKTAHEDFAGVNIVGGYPSGWNSDQCGHGTHVTGTIAAANNQTGVVGVSPGAVEIFAVQVFSGASCGWSYSSDLVNAANVCSDNGADIISMSLGGSRASRAEDRGFRAIESAGILSIAAAGNDGNTAKSYPASYNSVMSVAAVDSNNLIADFSQQNSAVEIAAPGVAVLSTVPWLSEAYVSVGGERFDGHPIEFAKTYTSGAVSGALVDGGFCGSSGSWAGMIVLCQRGGNFSFYDKVMAAQNGGAKGVVIYNNTAGDLYATLGDGNTSTIPAIGLSDEQGAALLSSVGSSVNLTNINDPNGSGYESWNGTSMATPHVSGVAALVMSAVPGASAAQVRAALTSTALDLGPTGWDAAYGFGLVQARAAIDSLGGGGPVNQAPTAVITLNCGAVSTAPRSCSFDGSGSSDPENDSLNYAWDFGDGAGATGPSVSHTFESAGSYTVKLTVNDGEKDGVATVLVTVDVPDGGGGGGGGGDTTPPRIIDYQATSNKGRLQVSWTTDEPTTGELFIANTSFTTGLSTSHTVNLKGAGGTVYTCNIVATDEVGNSSESGNFQCPQ